MREVSDQHGNSARLTPTLTGAGHCATTSRSTASKWRPTQLVTALALVMGCSGEKTDGLSNALKVPPRILDPDTQVSATVDCGEEKDCTKANVFVSACDQNAADNCYEIKPIDKKGNTYIISLTEEELEGMNDPEPVAEGDAGTGSAGDGDEQKLPGKVLAGATCKAARDSSEGLAVDLLFVIDTTSSMAGAIGGVVSSVDAFVAKLAEEKVDVRVGGIAFGDTAPLPCTDPLKPYAGFTETFGAGTADDEESFNFWLKGLGASYCGDGGGDGPENALDAIEFALGNYTPAPAVVPPGAPDAGTPEVESGREAFKWNAGSLRVIIVITDVSQHQKSDVPRRRRDMPEGVIPIAHYDIDEVKKDLAGVAVAHVIAPNFGCHGTPYASCACDVTPYTCDTGCTCDPHVPVLGCDADVTPEPLRRPRRDLRRRLRGLPRRPPATSPATSRLRRGLHHQGMRRRLRLQGRNRGRPVLDHPAPLPGGTPRHPTP